MSDELRAQLAAAKRAWECAIEERNEIQAERDELRALLREARVLVLDVDADADDWLARIDAFLKGDGDE
jgi:hypothetical protein